MTPFEAWLRGLSSDSCGPFRGAWATDELRERTEREAAAEDARLAYNDLIEDHRVLAEIAEQRIGEVVGRWRGGEQ